MTIYSYDDWQLQDMWECREIVDAVSPYLEYARVYVNIPYNIVTLVPKHFTLQE